MGFFISAGEVRGTMDFKADTVNEWIRLKAPDVLGGTYTLTLPVGYGLSGQVLKTNGSGVMYWGDDNIGGGGTVSSVDLDVPNFMDVAGGPVTGYGTFVVTLVPQSANRVFASPDGASGVPTFRSIVADDLPNHDLNSKHTGILIADKGGTGVNAPSLGDILIGGSGLWTKAAGNTASTRKFLSMVSGVAYWVNGSSGWDNAHACAGSKTLSCGGVATAENCAAVLSQLIGDLVSMGILFD